MEVKYFHNIIKLSLAFSTVLTLVLMVQKGTVGESAGTLARINAVAANCTCHYIVHHLT